MQIKSIYYSAHFGAAFKKLPKNLQKLALEKEKIFRADCFNPPLKTHKLKGQHSHYWSFSINYSYRIIFEFMPKNAVGFVDIGNHNIYR